MIIYKATNLVNGKIYIGKTTKSLDERKSNHYRDAFTKRTKMIFHKAIKKYGAENFTWEILDHATTEEELSEKEKFWIKQCKSYIYFDDSVGYNMTLGGDGQSGLKHTEESRQKMKESHMGEVLSEERKQKMSTTRKARGTFRGSNNNQAKLTEEDVINIKSLIKQGEVLKEIAKKFNVSEGTINSIKAGRRWAHTGEDLSLIDYRRSLKDEDVKEIKLLLKDGTIKQREIAKKFNVCETIICNIKSGKCYKNICI